MFFERTTVVMFLCATLLGACATNSTGEPAADAPSTTSDGELLRLGTGEHQPVWADWKPAADGRVRPESLETSMRAFDYWQVDGDVVIGDIWDSLFPALNALRDRLADAGQRASLDLMLGAIEPDRSDGGTRMDLTFVVSADDATRFEGLACRLYRPMDSGAIPAVTVVLLRDPARDDKPRRILVWAAPDFREPTPFSALFERSKAGWSNAVASGMRLPGDRAFAEAPREAGEGAELVASVLTKAIWGRFAGRAYLESPHSGATSDRPNPEGVEEALGLEVSDRRIHQVYSGTEFPPRADLKEL